MNLAHGDPGAEETYAELDERLRTLTAVTLALRAQSMLDVAPDGIILVDSRGTIIYANKRAEALFGRALVEVPVDELVPQRSRQLHEQERRDYMRDPTTRPMGAGRYLQGVRSDGSEFEIEVSLSPLKEAGQLYTIAIVREKERE